jgi:hypothetical protein
MNDDTPMTGPPGFEEKRVLHPPVMLDGADVYPPELLAAARANTPGPAPANGEARPDGPARPEQAP